MVSNLDRPFTTCSLLSTMNDLYALVEIGQTWIVRHVIITYVGSFG